MTTQQTSHPAVLQEFGTVRPVPLGLTADTRRYATQRLNRVLADTHMLYALYKKSHWQVRGGLFHSLHLLFDRHAGEQQALVDELAERVQILGGVAVADPRHAAELTSVPRFPDGAEDVPDLLHRLLRTHEGILVDAREAAIRLGALGDPGTEDLLVSSIVRTGERQSWFLAAETARDASAPGNLRTR
ncbi:DNA starvation/stationary phase protection protein [Streptomyces sp. NPDC052299]|uniref:Dps family protein n=1 Tax=Streptomyces sp. NPDC052299 TaxID=3155054 RepID=UPI00344A8007